MSISSIKQLVIPIFQKYGVNRASLFGSVARGEEKNTSDVDFLVEMPQNHSLMDRAKVKVALEDTLKIKCDVLNFNGIKKHARASILSSQVVILP